MADTLVDALEPIVVGSVALTARALDAVDPDLTLVQWRAVLVIGESDAGTTISALAERLDRESSPTSRLVGRLAGRGLLSTAKDPQDRRVTRVVLSEAGRRVRRRVLERRRAELGRLLRAGSVDADDAHAIGRLARAFEPYA